MTSRRAVQIEVRRQSGWETVSFTKVDRLGIASAPGNDGEGIVYSLIGERNDSPNQVESQILDVAERHRALIDSEFPVDEETGEALPVALRENS
jgi:hypothetical protein